MAVSPLVKPLGITAALLGIIQGSVWIILTFLTILIHFDAWTPKLPGLTYGQGLSLTIVNGYVNGDVSLGERYGVNLIIRPQEFYIWAFIYMFTSVLWTGFSSFLLFVIIRRKHDLLRKACLGWVIWTTIICITDILLTSLLASDYDTLVTAINKKAVPFYAAFDILACGVMMSLAARGFVLWIVNVTFNVILIIFFKNLPKKMTEDYLDSNTVDEFEAVRNAQHGTSTRRTLNRSNSFDSASFGTFTGLPRLPPIQSTNERLAQLNRRSFRSPHSSGPPPRNTTLYR